MLSVSDFRRPQRGVRFRASLARRNWEQRLVGAADSSRQRELNKEGKRSEAFFSSLCLLHERSRSLFSSYSVVFHPPVLRLWFDEMASCFVHPFLPFLRGKLYSFLPCSSASLAHVRFPLVSCGCRLALCSAPERSVKTRFSPVSLSCSRSAIFSSRVSWSATLRYSGFLALHDLQAAVSVYRASLLLTVLLSVFTSFFLQPASAFSLNRPGCTYGRLYLHPPFSSQEAGTRLQYTDAFNCPVRPCKQLGTWRRKTDLNFLAGGNEQSRPRCRDTQVLWDSREERFAALKSMKEQDTPKFQAPDWTPDQPLLEITDLHAEAVEDGQEILRGVSLTVMPGEIHAIMGRNGSGRLLSIRC